MNGIYKSIIMANRIAERQPIGVDERQPIGSLDKPANRKP